MAACDIQQVSWNSVGAILAAPFSIWGGHMARSSVILLAVLFASVICASAQETTARLFHTFTVVPNITYLTASNYESKLDLYVTRTPERPLPTLIYIHGGGWVAETKELRNLEVLPYLEMGMNVVNVDYRLAKIAHAPAAVEDARCALRWVISNAKQYGIDPERLVLAGGSAGAHLALLAAMLPQAEGFDRLCFGPDVLKVAAVVSWYGVTDLAELMDLPSLPTATIWLGSNPNREQLAKRISPLTYVRAGLPPMFLLHSVTDPIVPYSQSVRLHEALDKVGVANELLTIPGGRHGYLCCTLTERLDAYRKIREFLTRFRVLGAPN
jgi:acetyl esterase/lipase